jgi:hypothetical protein
MAYLCDSILGLRPRESLRWHKSIGYSEGEAKQTYPRSNLQPKSIIFGALKVPKQRTLASTSMDFPQIPPAGQALRERVDLQSIYTVKREFCCIGMILGR